jgi:hypothetical protein
MIPRWTGRKKGLPDLSAADFPVPSRSFVPRLLWH